MLSQMTPNQPKKRSFFRANLKWMVLAAIIVLTIPVMTVTIGAWTYSEGERSGTITKFTRKGVFLKTWEGELRMGGMDQGGYAENWEFSADDEAVIKKIQEAQRHGGKYTLKYRQQLMTQSWKGSTSYFVLDSFKEDR